jgi:hypothetical protein
MSIEVTVDFSEVEKMASDFASAIPAIDRIMNQTMLRAVTFAEGRIASKSPVNTGGLRASVDSYIKGTGLQLEGVIQSPLPYGLPVEEGRSSGKWPPIDAIELWVRRKLGLQGSEARSVAFLIARAIGQGTTRGIMRKGKGARMFRDGMKESEPMIFRLFEDATGQIVVAIAGGG